MKLWLKLFGSLLGLVIWVAVGVGAEAETKKPNYKLETDIFYLPGGEAQADEYAKQQCRLDLYYPENLPGFATVVWFHGGGLSGGKKYVPGILKNQELAVVAIEYRLAPKVKCPVYLEDAAAGVAWVMQNIARYGGDPARVFVSGHSAGAYLTAMLGLDKRWLAARGVDADRLAGILPLSGNMITHLQVRAERGINIKQPIIDDFAPLFHVRKDAPPLFLATGDRNLEMVGRYEENAYFWRMMKIVGHPDLTLYELQGYGHGMEGPALPLAVKWIKAHLAAKPAVQPASPVSPASPADN